MTLYFEKCWNKDFGQSIPRRYALGPSAGVDVGAMCFACDSAVRAAIAHPTNQDAFAEAVPHWVVGDRSAVLLPHRLPLHWQLKEATPSCVGRFVAV